MNTAGKKKSYRELKADPIIKAPVLAWILDRRMLYISLTTVACLAAGAFVYQGWKSYEEISAPVEEDSPYLAIDPSQSAGALWSAELLNDSRGIEGWEVRDTNQPGHGFLQDATGSTAGEVPITLLATRIASAGPVKSVAQVYGAGQARRQYDFYVDKLAARGPVDSKQVTDSGIYGAKFEQGFILVAGDAIVGAQTADNGLRDRLFDEYLGSVERTLAASGCVDISATDSSKRSIYFDPNSFEGLQETQEIEPGVNTDYLPTLQAIGANEISDPYAVAPEGPLPASLPALPEEVAKPTIADAPATVDDFTQIASYRIQDPIGPGCGWSWSAQNPLQYDEGDLKVTQDDTVTRVQNEVNSKAQEYVDSKISWARVVALVTPKLDSWNSYVSGVNTVHDRWAKLVSDRAAIRPAWDTYIRNYESWSTFDSRKAVAENSYSDSLAQCLAVRSTHDEWEVEWGPEALRQKQDEWRRQQEAIQARPTPAPTPAPTPGPTLAPTQAPVAPTEPTTPMPTAPPEPVDCAFDPARPLILDQQKPAKPEAPAIPEDVTIPDSWPKVQG